MHRTCCTTIPSFLASLCVFFTYLLPFANLDKLVPGKPYLIQNAESRHLLFLQDQAVELSNLRHFWYLDELSPESYLLRNADPTLFLSPVGCEIRVVISEGSNNNGLYQLHPTVCNGSSSGTFIFVTIKGKTVCVLDNPEIVTAASLYSVKSFGEILLELRQLPVQIQYKPETTEFDKSLFKLLPDFTTTNVTANGHRLAITQVLLPGGKVKGPVKVVTLGLERAVILKDFVEHKKWDLSIYCLEVDVLTGVGFYALKFFKLREEVEAQGCVLNREELVKLLVQKVVESVELRYESGVGRLTFVKGEREVAAVVGEAVAMHVVVGSLGLIVGVVMLAGVGYVLYTRQEE